jgi:autotransporter translocation and assembly factor TamB
MKFGRVRGYIGSAIVLVAIVVLALWQWKALTRFAVTVTAASIAHVALSFDPITLTLDRAVFENIRVTSTHGEPIAQIDRVTLTYDLRDLLPGGKRLFGLKSVEANSPRVTIVRHADGTFNVPSLQPPPSKGGKQIPLILRARLRNGSIDVINESPNAPTGKRHLYVENLQADADISSAAHSLYTFELKYGERSGDLYPVRGRGDINAPSGYIDQRWTAPALPIAAAVDFVVNSPSLRLDSGMLRNVEARYFALADQSGMLAPHLTGSAMLAGGRLAIAGLAQPVEELRGPVDVYDDGLLTPGLLASVAGTSARVSGGIYDLRDPHLRLAVRGAGDLASLRFAFNAARQLPMHGSLRFGLLVEGVATKPLTWIDLRAPAVTYASVPLERLSGLVALEGQRADVIDLSARYRGSELGVSGRVELQKKRDAVEMLLRANTATVALPYLNTMLPDMRLEGVALATADDPKAIGLRGVVWGAGRGEELDGLFNVDSRGYGSIGPLHVSRNEGSLYARVALDRPHGLAIGLARVRNLSIPAAKATLNATVFGGQSNAALGINGVARVKSAWGSAIAQARVVSKGAALEGGLFGRFGQEASFGASVAGTPHSPRLAGTVVVAGGRYRSFDVNGNAGLAFAGDTLHVNDAAIALGPLFIGAAGTVRNLLSHGTFAPRYDLATELHSSDLSALLAAVQPREAPFVQGSIDASLTVHGAGMRPAFAGTLSAPEGAVNGLSFRNFYGGVRGDPSALSLMRGRVTVRSTDVALSGRATTRLDANLEIRAPQADLADFNDLFDQGDTFAGSGHLELAATTRRMQIVSSSGDASFSGARFRRIALGDVTANWRGSGGSIRATLSFAGPAGNARASGSVAPAAKAIDMRATASQIDLGTWPAMLGYSVPVTGRLNAQTSISGRYPDVTMSLVAAVSGGTVGRLPVERFEVSASAAHGRGTIQSATLELPSLRTVASGTFGVRATDALTLTAHLSSPNIGSFLNEALGKDLALSGTLDSILRVSGTLAQPQLQDVLTLQSLQRGSLTIPRVYGEIDANQRFFTLRNGEIDFARGKAFLAAELPFLFAASRIAVGSGPIKASLTADDVELSNFLPLLPKATQMAGRIDGSVVAGGTFDAPRIDGSFALRDGRFVGPLEKSPITGIGAELALRENRAALQARGTVGGGSFTAQGVAALTNLREPAGSSFNLQARAANARLDLPDYFAGELNAGVDVERAGAGAPLVTGEISVANARIPLNTFVNQKGSANERPALPNLAFATLRIIAGNNVRIQSANVDIGATGEATLGGTLDAPVLAGSFSSTGGSISFYRSFNLESGKVTFEPSSGVIPDVDAVATTFVSNPATAIRLHVTGPVSSMNLALASEPSYSREQILGLLVGAQQFGAVQGVNSTGGQAFSAGSAATQFALGQVNTLFTRNLLQPLSASLASSLGFTNVQITSDLQTGLGINAVKAFGKNVNAIFAQTFGYPSTQSVTIEANPSVGTGLRGTWYTTSGPTLFVLQQPQLVGMDVLNLNRLTQLPPPTGTNGVSFSFLRKFP